MTKIGHAEILDQELLHLLQRRLPQELVTHYQNAFAAIYLSEEDDPAPRMTHFDNGFDVLFDADSSSGTRVSPDTPIKQTAGCRGKEKFTLSDRPSGVPSD